MAIAMAADYAHMLHELRPRGPAMLQEDTVLNALAEELARAHNRALNLIEEADPRNTSELFDRWEQVFGLPDPCVTSEQNLAQRRAALVTKVVTTGGQSPQYYINIALALGYEITITEFHEHTVDDDVDYPLYDEQWLFAWQVNAALNTVQELSVEDDVETPLAWWSNEILECVLDRLKPAHTSVIYSYS